MDTPARHRRTASPRRRRTLLVLAAVVLMLLLLAGGTVALLLQRLGDNVERIPGAFAGLDEAARPAPIGGTTFLLVGTDTRADGPTTGGSAVGGDRSDALMLARLAADGTSAAVVSIPRDSWVEIPGRGPNKINAAYAFGGPSLLIKTVENLSGVHVDHFAVVDFAGFTAVVDSVGGIDVTVAQPTRDRGVDFHRGVNHLDGAQALVYVRQRYGLADGDLDRAQRQQAALRAVLGKAASSGMLADPVALYGFLDATSRVVGVDDTLTNGGLQALAFSLRDLRPANVTFLRAPVAGFGREGDQAVDHLDAAEAGRLWAALREGSVAEYVARHRDDVLGPVTR